MDKPVLKYCHEDFDVIIQTNEIQSAWERFQGRINYRNDWTEETSETHQYCAYDASDDCTILLYDYDRAGTLISKVFFTFTRPAPPHFVHFSLMI